MIQRAWRSFLQRKARRERQEAQMQDGNILFKGEFALSNSDKYDMCIDKNEEGLADCGDIDSDNESQMETLSIIYG